MATKKPVKKAAAPAIKAKRRSGYVFNGKSLKGSNKKGAGAGG